MGDSSYEIIDRCFDGIYTVGFTVKDTSGNKKMITVSDTIKLARRGALVNAKYVMDILSGEYLLKVDGDIDKQFKNSRIQLTLTCRLLDKKGTCVGYKATDSNGKRYNLSIKKTWELAFNHNVKGIKAILIGNNKAIKSINDFKLELLPKIQSKG